jgi:IS1 family transposase/transposase-like protein
MFQYIYESIRTSEISEKTYSFFTYIQLPEYTLQSIRQILIEKGFSYLFHSINEIIEKFKIPNIIQSETEIIHQKSGKGQNILRCPLCKNTSSIQHWTPVHNARHSDEEYCRIIKAIGEGVGIRSISRIFEIDKDTVLRYIQKTAKHCRSIDEYFFKNLNVDECQLDELWSFVNKKEKQLSEAEKHILGKGDTWIWIGFDAVHKIIISKIIGKRTQSNALKLLENITGRLHPDCIPFYTSDNLDCYENALLYFYGKKITEGKKVSIVPNEKLDYAKVCKKRENGRVVDIIIEVCFGNKERILERLENSEVSNCVNTSFVERQNLTRRLNNRRLTRKTLGFSKTIKNHINVFDIETSLYHFCKPHIGLTKKLNDGATIKQTPAMAAGLTNHIWTVNELLNFSLPR